jgi:hypothetical protein
VGLLLLDRRSRHLRREGTTLSVVFQRSCLTTLDRFRSRQSSTAFSLTSSGEAFPSLPRSIETVPQPHGCPLPAGKLTIGRCHLATTDTVSNSSSL